jgi:hypothetical protein
MDQTSGKSVNDITYRINDAMSKLNAGISDNGKDLCNDLKLIFRFGKSYEMNDKFCSLIEPIRNLSFHPNSLGEKMKDVLYKYCHKDDYYFVTESGDILTYQGFSHGNSCVVYYYDSEKMRHEQLSGIMRKYTNIQYMLAERPITCDNLSHQIYKPVVLERYEGNGMGLWVIVALFTVVVLIIGIAAFLRGK